MLAAGVATWRDLQAYPTWKDLQDYPTWNDLADSERRAEQAQQQMWLEYSEVMQQTQAQVQALAYRLDLRLEELEARQWLPELPPGLPQQRFIPHWSAAVGAAELAEGFPPIDLTQTIPEEGDFPVNEHQARAQGKEKDAASRWRHRP